jgi:RNA polymerase sigma factor (sigma-70 family)
LTEIAVAQGRDATPDGVLVQEAAAGSGVSYGALYDRYATQVFNYCLRLTGSTEDAADATQEAFVNVLRRLQDDDRPVLDFSAYLFAAARHESYGLMRQRARQQPSESPPEERGRIADLETDPERSVLLRDDQEAVRQANAKLPPRHREVLALREVAGRSYDEVGEIMGISGNAAAQLIFRARGKLREALTAGAVASVVATSEECERAQMLLNRIQDAEPVDEYDREWLDEHLDECGSCKTANRMLLEAGASYRLWAPVALLAGMRSDTLAEAGGVVGADWSNISPPGKSAASSGGSSAGSSAGGAVAAAAGAVVVAAGIAFIAITGGDDLDKASSSGEKPAADATAVVESAPAGRDAAKAAAPDTPLAAARAPVSSRTPGDADSPVQQSDAPAPKDQSAPDRRFGGPEGGPGPPGGNPSPGTPGPKGEAPGPPGTPPADPTPPGNGPPQTGPPGDPPPAKPDPTPPTSPPVDTSPPPAPPPSECSFPGGGGGPDGCPPGHGGVPPGHGGTPPGRAP